MPPKGKRSVATPVGATVYGGAISRASVDRRDDLLEVVFTSCELVEVPVVSPAAQYALGVGFFGTDVVTTTERLFYANGTDEWVDYSLQYQSARVLGCEVMVYRTQESQTQPDTSVVYTTAQPAFLPVHAATFRGGATPFTLSVKTVMDRQDSRCSVLTVSHPAASRMTLRMDGPEESAFVPSAVPVQPPTQPHILHLLPTSATTPSGQEGPLMVRVLIRWRVEFRGRV